MKKIVASFAVLAVCAALLCGCFALPAATKTIQPAATASLLAVKPGTLSDGFSYEEAMKAFEEIAFSAEYGGDRGAIVKWQEPIRLKVSGKYTQADSATLAQAIKSINLVNGFPGISIVEGNGNGEMSFVTLASMADAVPGYVSGNWGFFMTWRGGSGFTEIKIAIATDVTDQMIRNHLIYEELYQSLGLMQDSNSHPDSIFYGPWTTVQQPSRLDWVLLRMLYLPKLQSGMGADEARLIIKEAWD